MEAGEIKALDINETDSGSAGYAIVTGGGSGIGRAFCHALAKQGWTVAVVDCRSDSAEQVASELQTAPGAASSHHLDVADALSWHELRSQLQVEWPRLDLLVNNAGVLSTGTLDDCQSGDIQRIVEVNLLGAMFACNAMLPWLRQTRSTALPRGVINLASIFAAVSPPGFAAYNATKAGMLSLTETLRGELKPFGLNATAVLPGATPTRLFQRARYATSKQSDLCREFIEQSTITPEQVAEEALRGACRKKLYVVVGGRAKLYWRLKQWSPQWLIDLVGRRAVDEFGVLERDKPPATDDVRLSDSEVVTSTQT